MPGDDDSLSQLQSADRVAEVNDFGDALVTDREGTLERCFAADQEPVEVAGAGGEGPHECLAVAMELRIVVLAPLEAARFEEGEGAHVVSLITGERDVWRVPAVSWESIRVG
jgi:hypothetical protein